MREQHVWRLLHGLQVDNRVWDTLATATMAHCHHGLPGGKLSHLLNQSRAELDELSQMVLRIRPCDAKVIGRKLGLGKSEWKQAEKDNYPVQRIVFDALQAVVMTRPVHLAEPLTLYVSMPVWWYRWDSPNRVFDRMNQSGRFTIDSPLLA